MSRTQLTSLTADDSRRLRSAVHEHAYMLGFVDGREYDRTVGESHRRGDAVVSGSAHRLPADYLGRRYWSTNPYLGRYGVAGLDHAFEGWGFLRRWYERGFERGRWATTPSFVEAHARHDARAAARAAARA